MSSYSVQVLQDKLARLSLSQDSIETLSLWMIHHKSKAKTSVAVWLEEFQKGDADRRLILLYLTNDVLQNGRRRGADVFLDFYKDALLAAIPLVRGQKIQTSVERMFRIWKERKVYDNVFLRELERIVLPANKSQAESKSAKPAEFKLSLLEDAITELRKFEAELNVKSSHLTHLRVDITDPFSSLSQLKDKADGGRVSLDFNDAYHKLQDYCECLGIEVNERINILDMLKDTKEFTTYKLNEFRRTVQNFKDLETVVDTVKEKLQHRLKDFERAQSTATSDPSAQEDITVVGDMEIESDNESQDESSQVPQTLVPAQQHQTLPLVGQSPPVMSKQQQVSLTTSPQTLIKKHGSVTTPLMLSSPLTLTPAAVRTLTPTQQQQQRFQPLAVPTCSNTHHYSNAPPIPTNSNTGPSAYPRMPLAPPGSNSSRAIYSNMPRAQLNTTRGAYSNNRGAYSGASRGQLDSNRGAFSNSTVPPARFDSSNRGAYSSAPRGQLDSNRGAFSNSNAPPAQMDTNRGVYSNVPPPSSGGNTINRPSGPYGGVHGIRQGAPPPVRPRLPPPRRAPPFSHPPSTSAPAVVPPRAMSAIVSTPTPTTTPTVVLPRAMSALATYETPAVNNAPASSKESTIVGAPILYKDTQKVEIKTETLTQESISMDSSTTPVAKQVPMSEASKSETSPLGENKPSLDERLKNLMTNKLFGKSILNEQSDSEAEEKLYSPSSDLLPSSVHDAEDEHDVTSTPVTGQASPGDGSPHLNMDNPILQALYSSQKEPAAVSPLNDIPVESTSVGDIAKVDTGLLKDILETVKTAASHKAQEEMKTQQAHLPPSQGPVKPVSLKPTGPEALSEIKITPALTNLLDELLPSLSRSLQVERKRKQGPSETGPQPKVSRNTEHGPGALLHKPQPTPPWLLKQQDHDPPQHREFFTPPRRPQFSPQRTLRPPRPNYQKPPRGQRYGTRPPPPRHMPPRFPPRAHHPQPRYYNNNEYRSEVYRRPTDMYHQDMGPSGESHGPAEAGGPYRPDFNRRPSYH